MQEFSYGGRHNISPSSTFKARQGRTVCRAAVIEVNHATMRYQRKSFGLLTALACVWLATGCGRVETPSQQKLAVPEADAENIGEGLANLAPDPKQGFEITLTFEGAPGPFAVVNGGAQYDVVNEDECGRIHPVAGTPLRITSLETVPLIKVSEHEYRGVVYWDLIRDENYFGRGVCRWELSGAVSTFVASGAPGETRFQIFVPAAQLAENGAFSVYYPGIDYPRVEGYPDYPSNGKSDLSLFKPELRESAFKVSVKVSPAKNQQ